MKTYEIDLSKSQFDRWGTVANEEAESIRVMSAVIMRDLSLSGPVGFMIKRIIHALYLIFRWPYYKEILGIASYSGYDVDDIILINASYELDQISRFITALSRLTKIFACTSIATKTDDGVVVGRNFDCKYDVDDLKGNICKFIFKRPDGFEFETVGYPGFIGVNTGILRGRFGIVFNSGPTAGITNPRYIQPSIMIRKILEKHSIFEEAQCILGEQFLCSSGIFTLFDRDRISVFERTKDKSAEILTNQHVACNHFTSKLLQRYSLNSVKSRSRADIALSLLRELENPTYEAIVPILRKVSINQTMYKSIITTDEIQIIE